MKALTISQPFASLIADGEKWIENRSWFTKYRGQLAIHAGVGTQYLTKSELADYPTSCIVAVCYLVSCVTLEHMQKLESRYLRSAVFQKTGRTVEEILGHKHTEGPVLWILKDVRKLEHPIPCKGRQGLWVSEELKQLQQW
jgi:hypothetical protein